jgi:hypothetical protein
MKLATLNRRNNISRAMCALVSVIMLVAASTRGNAQAGGGNASMPSPPATATATVGGGTIDVHYNSPHLRGRHVGGPEIVPYGQVWRTGANPATTLITSVPLLFGTLQVPAGTHTIYTLPTADTWQLIINNETGQWGTEYKPEMDLGRIPMKAKPMTTPQEVMSISFENTTAVSTELHVRWDTTDRYVVIHAPQVDPAMAKKKSE